MAPTDVQQSTMSPFNFTLVETTVIPDSGNSVSNVTGSSKDSELEGYNDSLENIPVSAFVFLVIFISLIFIASLIGNIFVFVVFYKRRAQLMTISNRFVMNLSVSCFLITVFVMPFSIVTMVTSSWQFGDGWCQITGMLTTLLISACILTLLLIACDRYAAIVSPFHYNARFTTDRSTYMIAGVWTLSVLYSLPPIFGWNYIAYQPAQGSCTVKWRNPESAHMSYTIFLTIVCFLLPFGTMLWIYIVLYRATQKITARARRNSVQPDSNSSDGIVDEQRTISRKGSTSSLIFTRRNSSSSNVLRRQDSLINGRRRSSLVGRSLALIFHKDDWKAAKTGLVVIATFLLCWSPYFVVILIESILGTHSRIPAVVQCLVYWVALSASAINPMVYVFRNTAIRREFKILFRRGSTSSDTNVQMRPCRRSVDSVEISPQDRARLAHILAKRIDQQNMSSSTLQTSFSRNGSAMNEPEVSRTRKNLSNTPCQTLNVEGIDSMSRVDI